MIRLADPANTKSFGRRNDATGEETVKHEKGEEKEVGG
jgi:hypothetical protein